jgi:hypothetical protein
MGYIFGHKLEGDEVCEARVLGPSLRRLQPTTLPRIWKRFPCKRCRLVHGFRSVKEVR